MTIIPGDDRKNIMRLTAPFEDVGLSTDVPLVSPMIVDPPAGDVAVDATSLPMNMNPEGTQDFIKQLNVYQPLGSVQTRWGTGFYSCTGNEAAFLVEQPGDRPGDRMAFHIENRGFLGRKEAEEDEIWRITCDESGIPLSVLYEASFNVAFEYVVGDYDMHLTQVAKLTPDGTHLGIGVYLLYFKTPMLRTMADAVGDDEVLHRIASALEQGKQRELLDEKVLKHAPPNMLDRVVQEIAFVHINPFTSEGYVKPASQNIKSLIGGAAKLVPNLMTKVPTAPLMHG